MFGAVVSVLSAILSVALAVFTWQQAQQVTDTETRVIVADFLTRFNSDDMWSARQTLVSYRNFIEKSGGQEIVETTYEQLAYHVFATGDVPRKELSNLHLLTGKVDGTAAENHERNRNLFLGIDRSRRRIRNFYLDAAVYECNAFFQSPLRKWIAGTASIEKVLMERFQPTSGTFLREMWLPIEKAENKARMAKATKEALEAADRRAEVLVEWFEGKKGQENCRMLGAKPAGVPGPSA